MVTMSIPAQTKLKRKRVSKKLKSSWRKHVDTADVDNFLEDQRLEERLGDYSELSNNELFTLDTEVSKPQLTSKQLKRQKLRTAPLRCLALLQPLTKVPDPIAKRNRVRTKEERKNELIKKKEAANKAKGIFKKKDLQVVKDIHHGKQKRESKESKYDFDKDIWEEDLNTLVSSKTKQDTVVEKTVVEDSWIQGDARRHLLHGPGKMSKTTPKSVHKKPYILNPVEIPHPGMSYNPSLQDHQDLLRLIVEKEQKIIKEEEHLQRVTEHMFKKVTPAQRDSNWLVEMSEGLKPDQSHVTKTEEDGVYKPINPPVKNKEKSKQQRRKQKEQLMQKEELRRAKIEKKKLSDMYRLRFINKSIERREKKVLKLHEKRLKKEEYKKSEAKRLGANKFEEPELPFNMARDIAGNLRNIKKEGNLLNDRFKSLQKRNIIEPTVIKSHKKAKVKQYVKTAHKEDFWKSSVTKKLTI